VNEKQNRSFQLRFKGTVVLTLICGTALLTAPPGHTGQQGPQHGSMPGMDMHDNGDMRSMGASMAAMAGHGHMYMTPLRPKQPATRRSKGRCSQREGNYRALQGLPQGSTRRICHRESESQAAPVSLINDANTREADLHFDPRKPTALLYRRTPMQEYKLEGVMYTANPTQPKMS